MLIPNRLGRRARLCAKYGLAQEPYWLKGEVGRTHALQGSKVVIASAVLRFVLDFWYLAAQRVNLFSATHRLARDRSLRDL